MKKFLFILFAIAMALGSASAAEKCAGIDAGTKAYNESDFERAIDEWRTCVDNGVENADLFYNLGNAYFRNGKLGFSIFYYKKALRLRATDDDILHNLKYAEAMTRDKVEEDDEENPLLTGLFKAHHALSLKMQLLVLIALFWVIAIILTIQKVSIKDSAKNLCTGAVFILTTIFCVIGASAAYKIVVLETEITGVVTAADADVTSAPSDKSQTLNTLSEGTSFEVLSLQGNFAEIRLGDKIKGFVKLSEVGIIK